MSNNNFNVQDRIVIHLSNFNGFRDNYLNPASITQDGIADAVGIARNHVPRAMNSLKGEELVTEAKGRVKGSDRRKKVYYLSEKGVQHARTLREKVRHVDNCQAGIPQAPDFVGRETELREIKKCLAPGKAVMIHGPDGMGKTYLASKVASEYTGMPVLWHSFREHEPFWHFLASAATFLTGKGYGLFGYYLASAKKHEGEKLAELLSDGLGNCLVVLDGFQNADQEVNTLLAQLIRGPCKARILLLSNKKEGIGEGLNGRLTEMPLRGLDRKSVRELLGGCADAEKIAKVTETLPLFLKIARTGGAANGSLEESIGEMMRKMALSEISVMNAISVHNVPADLEAISKMSGADYQIIVNLVDKGLIHEAGSNSFDTHGLLKQLFYAKMKDSERRKMHMAAARCLLAKGGPIKWFEAQAHLLKAGKQKDSARSVVSDGVRLIQSGERQQLEHIVEQLDEEAVGKLLWADILLIKGYLAKLRGEWEKSLGHYRRAMEIFEKEKSEEKIADALAKIGRVHFEKGEYDPAMSHFETALKHLGGRPHIVAARVLDEMATVNLRRRELAKAEELAGKALEMANEVGDLDMEARVHNTLGNISLSLGTLQKAAKHYSASLEYLQDRDEQMAIILRNNLAIIQFKTGNVDKALELWEIAAAKADAMKSLSVMLTYSNMGSVYFDIGRWERATECANKALQLSEMVDKHMITAASRSTLGYIDLFRDGNGWKAQYENALELRRKLGDVSGQASSLNDLARAYAHVGDWDSARKHADEALRLASEKNDMEQLTIAHLNLAIAAANTGDYSAAKSSLKLALVKAKEMENRELIGLAYMEIGRVSAREEESFVAERYLKESAEIFEKERRPLLLALALVEYANVLKKSGLGEPEPSMRKGMDILRSLGVPGGSSGTLGQLM